MCLAFLMVAPLAGSVDRNVFYSLYLGGSGVAPLAGSVDRNHAGDGYRLILAVAPLAGSVDRNIHALFVQRLASVRSLPSRGAWIEMVGVVGSPDEDDVAPLAGSVDRNS